MPPDSEAVRLAIGKQNVFLMAFNGSLVADYIFGPMMLVLDDSHEGDADPSIFQNRSRGIQLALAAVNDEYAWQGPLRVDKPTR